MARALRDEQVTPADELRRLLAESEYLVANLSDDGSEALRLLRDLDQTAELWPQLEGAGLDLRPEMGRWQTVQGLVRRRGRRLLRALRGLGGLAAVRAREQGAVQALGQPGWWWELDRQIAAQNRRQVLTAAAIAGGVVLAGIALVLILRTLFPQDPNVAAATAALMSGQQKAQDQGDLHGALGDFQQATAILPGDAEGWLWLGATRQKLGDQAGAQQAFERARTLLPGEQEFRLQRASAYLGLQMLEQAQADLDAVLASDRQNPEALYFLSSVFEARQQYAQAIDALQKASDAADQRQNPELVAMARFRLAMLMQQMQVNLTPATPTGP